MNIDEYEKGATVRFRHPQGSIGRVIGRHASHWRVEWTYGTDRRGEPITSIGAVLPGQAREPVRVGRAVSGGPR